MYASKKSSTVARILIKIVFLLLSSVSFHAHGALTKAPTNNVSRSKFSIWPKTKVRVYNNLGSDITLTLHCKSKDDDLGVHLLLNGDSFQWRFHPELLGDTTFTCDMEWGHRRGTFDIYEDNRDTNRCIECVWKVTQDGVRGYSKEGGVEQIWFRWVPKPPPKD